MSSDATEKPAVRNQMPDQAQTILASILRSVDYGILLSELNRRDLYCNERFAELLGLPIHEVLSRDPDQLRDLVRNRVKNWDAWVQNLNEVYADPERVQSDEFRLVNPLRVLRRYTGPVRDEAGKTFARLWTFQDRTAEVRLEAMRNCLHETSLIFDPNPRVVYDQITQRAAAFYESVSVLSIRHDDYMEFRSIAGVPPDFNIPGNPLADAYCQFCLEGNSPFIVQDALKDPVMARMMPALAGITRYAGVPLRNPDEQFIGTFCIMDGRSDEPLDEEDIRFLSLLAMRVSSELERERQLSKLAKDLAETQSSLIQSEKLAITGTLAASIAHDIRNILSAISLTISMGQDDPEQTLFELQGHLKRFQILSHKLLSYARPQKVLRKPVDLKEVIDRVIDLLKSYFRVSNVKVVQEIATDLPMVSSDPSHLDHVFVNLLLNGIQASTAGQVIRVEAGRKEAGVLVTIRDQGQGIDSQTLAELFQPFSTNRSNGLGLGLYSCKQIVKDCGGKISVSSIPGEGTTFQIELPAWTQL